jgi:hypothetical protein
MSSSDELALQSETLAKIAMIGRRTMKKISLPDQFVYEQNRIYLLPFMGKKTSWFLNLKQNPAIGIRIGGKKLDGIGTVIEETSIQSLY